MIRTSTAIWKGPGITGAGQLTIQSDKLLSCPFDFKGRFSIDAQNINPEELIAAAHAMDFVMKLSFVLDEAGHTADFIETTAHISFVNGSITGSHLILKAKIKGIEEELFEQSVKEAELTCPVSRALNIPVTVEMALVR
jgi:osmotically inducible protein OsmC